MKLWPHQEKAVELAKDGRRGLGLFLPVVTGKTYTAIEILSWHFSQKRNRALVLAPPVVLENWKREILKFSSIKNIFVLSGSAKQRCAVLMRALQSSEEFVVVTNYEGLLMKDLYELLSTISFSVFIADELHYLKNISAKRTKLAVKLSSKAPYRYGLTGTPVLNSPMDLFGQYKVLFGGFPVFKDGKEMLLENFKIYGSSQKPSFLNRFFYDANACMPRHTYFPKWKLLPGAINEINDTVARTSVYAKKTDCLKLPPFIQKRYDVPMTDEQAKAYKEMSKDFITFLNDKACTASLALTKALRLQQIVSGFAVLENNETHHFSSKRPEILQELLEELTPEHKVIVWCVFKEDYGKVRAACKNLNVGFAEIHGGITAKQNEADRFNNDPSIRVMVANPVAGGVGINLTASSHSIYFSRSFSFGADTQSEARNYRGGSEIHERIVRIDLVTPGTIDELVLERLNAKKELSDSILEADFNNELLQAMKEHFK